MAGLWHPGPWPPELRIVAETVLFGRYRLEAPLGAGGSAQVWRAVDKRTGETVAVKRLHPLVSAGEAGRERLLREFRVLRDLDEPHVVRVRDLELTDDDGALIPETRPAAHWDAAGRATVRSSRTV
jgi:hypothetical protein